MASETKSSTRNSCQISLEMLEIWKRSAQPNGSFLAWMPVEWSGQESCFAGGMSTFSIPSRQPGSTPVGRTSALKRGDTKVVAIWWTDLQHELGPGSTWWAHTGAVQRTSACFSPGRANTKPETPAFLWSFQPMCSSCQVSSKNLSPVQIIQYIFFPFFIVIDLVFNYLETCQV